MQLLLEARADKDKAAYDARFRGSPRVFLWAPVWYMVCNGYVLGSRSGALRKTLGGSVIFPFPEGPGT